MASNYPSGLDSFTNPAGTDNLAAGIGHASQHANANDAIEAIEGELGLNPRGGSATVKARFDAIEANSWVTSARIADATITGTDIASGTITSTNILDGTILNADINAAAAIDISKISGGVTSATVGNLLTTNQASFETDTTGWAANSNCTIARSTAQASHGSASLALTSSAAGTMLAQTPDASAPAVVAGQTYTAMADIRAATDARSVGVLISWLNSSRAYISTSAPTYTANSTSAWTTFRLTAVAPATAAYASVYVAVISTGGASEVHYADKVSLHQGAGGLWALPGTPIANLGTYTDESVGRRIFTWDNVNARYQMTYSDTGVRDIAALVTNGWTVDYALCCIRRMGNTVQFTAILNPSASTTAAPLTIPSGFRTAANMMLPLMPLSSDIVKPTFLEDNGSFTVYGTGRGSVSLYAAGQWATNDAWPSSLPGTASGSIPQ